MNAMWHNLNISWIASAWRRAVYAAVVLLSLWSCPLDVRAQGPLPWSDPLLLNEGTEGNSPAIVADSSGTVHVFWGSYGGDGVSAAIFYRRLQDGVWSEPVDIIVGPDTQRAVLPQAVIDAQGWLHLVWDSNGVFYSRAPVATAGSARAWTVPVRLSEAQATTPDIAVDDEGRLHVVYVDMFVSPFVRYTSSEDAGTNWMSPVAVSAPQDKAYALNARLLVDRQRTLHVIWSESIEPFPPSGIYYARSTDLGQTWTAPFELAAGGYSWGSIGMDGEGMLHVFWTGTADWVGKYHTWSPDGGQNWQPVERLWPGTGGMLGFADMAVDGAGIMHLVSAAGSGTFFPVATQGEILHVMWLGDHWSAPSHISLPTMNSFREHSFPQIGIERGKTVHVVWTMLNQDPQNQGQYEHVWYASALLPIPELPAAAVPDPLAATAVASAPTPTPASTQVTEPTRTTPPPLTASPSAAPASTSSLPALVLAVGPALALVAAVVLRQLITRNSRRW